VFFRWFGAEQRADRRPTPRIRTGT